MASDVAPLPREPDTLIEMVLELRDENGKLRAMLETLRRTLYGARSERFDAGPGQLALGARGCLERAGRAGARGRKAAVARWTDPRQAGAQHRRPSQASAA